MLIFCLSFLINCQQKEKKAKYIFRVGHVANEEHTWHKAFLYFSEILKERSNGEIDVQVFPSEQLGKEVEIIRSIKAGIVDMTITGGTLQNWSEIACFSDLPYLFRDGDHMQQVTEGEIGKFIKGKLLEDTNMRAVAYFIRGPRYLTTNRPIRHPDDLKGIILRVPNVPSYVSAWEASGAKPTPMAFSEVFTSLQQGAIEAQENPLAMIYTSSFFEVQKYLNQTEHLMSWGYIMVGEKQFQQLTPDLQKLFLECAKEMQEYEHQLFLENESTFKKLILDKGMEFIEVDKTAFQEKAAPAVYQSLSPDMQALYTKIKELN